MLRSDLAEAVNGAWLIAGTAVLCQIGFFVWRGRHDLMQAARMRFAASLGVCVLGSTLYHGWLWLRWHLRSEGVPVEWMRELSWMPLVFTAIGVIGLLWLLWLASPPAYQHWNWIAVLATLTAFLWWGI